MKLKIKEFAKLTGKRFPCNGKKVGLSYGLHLTDIENVVNIFEGFVERGKQINIAQFLCVDYFVLLY